MANDRLRTALRDAGLFLRFEWGNEVNANLAGTTASARGTDPASFARFAMAAQPEPFVAAPASDGGTWLPPWVQRETKADCDAKTAAGLPCHWDDAKQLCLCASDGPGVIGGNWGADPNNPVGGGLLDLLGGSSSGTPIWKTGAFFLLGIVIIAVGLLALTR